MKVPIKETKKSVSLNHPLIVIFLVDWSLYSGGDSTAQHLES